MLSPPKTLLLLLVALPSQLWVLILPLLLAVVVEAVAALQLCMLLLPLLMLQPWLPLLVTTIAVGTALLCVRVPPSSLLLPVVVITAATQLCSARVAAEGQAAIRVRF